jgi:hypothetical protein
MQRSGSLKVSIITALMLISSGVLYAKKGNDSLFVPHKNIIKMRTVYPILDLVMINEKNTKLVGISYERVIAKKRSIDVSADFGIQYTYTNGYGGYSKSTGISLYGEYRFYPFNRRKVFPSGFFISPSLALGAFSGWNEILSQSTFSSTTSKVLLHSTFKVITLGGGAILGWQYFIGKRKQFTLTQAFGLYVNKNYTISENPKLYTDNVRIYPKNEVSVTGYSALYLGYSYGKSPKKASQ